ncbi:MAG: ABC transporter ATP-binding protein [Myxococcota bacterium]
MSAVPPIVELRGVTKRFGSLQALAGVDLELHAGRILGLVGPNGAGKTTLFSVLCGFLRADSGTVRVAGNLVDTAHPPARGVVGLLPQDAAFRAHMPVGRQLTHYAELAGMDRAAAEADARAALERVGLAGSWKSRPRSLSHGMGKRVAIAQAILGDPRLVILDEPTAGLDPHAARELKAVLRVLREGRTIIVSSHNLSEIEDLCHEVAILHRGAIVRHDSVVGLVGSAAEIGLRLALPPTDAQIRAIEGLALVVQVRWDPSAERLRVHFDPTKQRADVACRDLVAHLVAQQIPFVEIQIGKSLEERFIEETGAPS